MNPAYEPYLNSHRAHARLALALKERGWEIFGYTDGDPDAKQEINVAHWHGYAKHPDYPDVIVVCGITDSNEQVYRSLDWPDKFKPNWANGWYYHIEFEGKYKTMGSGTSWGGDLSEKGKESVQTHAEYITDRAQEVRRQAHQGRREGRQAEGDRRAQGRTPRRQAGQGRSQGRRAPQGKGKKKGKQAGAAAGQGRRCGHRARRRAQRCRGRSAGSAGSTPKRKKKERRKSIRPTWSSCPP